MIMTHPPAPLLDRSGRPAIESWALDPYVRHLNHGSFGAVPKAAVAHQAALKAEMEAAPVAFIPGVPDRIAATRAHLAPLLGVDVDRLALVPNASGGVSAVFGSLALSPGAEVLITDHGYGAVNQGAERLVRRIGGRVVTAAVPLAADAGTAFDAVFAAVTERTELIVVDHLTSPTARLMPVAQICAEARKRGIRTLVDGAHVPMMIPDAITDAGADFWVGNLHKHGCAPRGCAVLVAHPDHAQDLWPLIDSWGYGLGFPGRFDHQGTLDLTSWIAAPTSIETIEAEFGWDTVRAYNRDLASWAQQAITAAFEELFDEDCSVEVGMPADPIRLVGLPRVFAGHEVMVRMQERLISELGMETAFTGFDGRAFFRLSAHAYLTAADFEDFIDRAVPTMRRLVEP